MSILKLCESYPHLANIWLSDVCRRKEQLEIDVSIGADYLQNFQTGNVVRGGVGEPVAVENQLGWVISGPLEYSQSADREQAVSVNFVGSDGTMKERHSGFFGFKNIRNHREQRSVQGICR